MSLVIGEISYTNILPLYYDLDREYLESQGCIIKPQVPSELNREMSAGRVDVGGISSFAYAENKDHFTLFPNLSVSALGKVGSIFLFSKVPIHQLTAKKVALTSTSATSTHLLKIILERFYEQSPRYTTMKPNIHKMLSDHDACLLIGDEAIVASFNKREELYQYDLGELWYKHTGMPMTFAVLAIRNEAIDHNSHLAGTLYRSFLESKKRSEKSHYQPMIQDILKTYGGDKSFWEDYFNNLIYDFSNREQRGLMLYYQLAYDLGYLSEPVESIHVWKAVGS
ncbi:menaquinone biosynthesis protein [Alkalihalophilus pseudofirmus]|uniref:Chorismate dehydratase n=1 Tax=Alkalihalophilus pseudofirmus TaxID=79885 RepID=A0AAJ2L0M9_ALKPS|nr:menaquinone biosynthesis protein [Alkalihalophilus pseudofirmus]MDV2884325.1 menaquinone biosynthesis protein [Alkalihalophilus pseudofirmus]WEG18344.1 menaquinone biosynthesis protein [Alkalihalophilus pseudofirmus]